MVRELVESYKAAIIDGVPDANLELYCPGLHGLGATLIDRSVNANHGTIVGASWKRLPSGLYVLDFDGDTDYITFGITGISGAAGSFLCWVIPDFDYDEAGNKDILYIWGAANVLIAAFNYTASTDKWQFTNTGASVCGSAAQTFVAGALIHLAITWDNTVNKKIYLDAGTPVTVATTWTALTPTNAILGAYLDHAQEFFDGVIAIPKLYSRVLTAAEITQQYNREITLLRS